MLAIYSFLIFMKSGKIGKHKYSMKKVVRGINTHIHAHLLNNFILK